MVFKILSFSQFAVFFTKLEIAQFYRDFQPQPRMREKK